MNHNPVCVGIAIVEMPSGITNSGRMRDVCSSETIGRGANTMMNVNRYSASGAIHSSGADATSVVRCVVTPKSKLDGANDLSFATNGTKPFVKKVKYGDAYDVTRFTNPTHPTADCVVTDGAGTATAPVTINVACTDAPLPKDAYDADATFTDALG